MPNNGSIGASSSPFSVHRMASTSLGGELGQISQGAFLYLTLLEVWFSQEDGRVRSSVRYNMYAYYYIHITSNVKMITMYTCLQIVACLEMAKPVPNSTNTPSSPLNRQELQTKDRNRVRIRKGGAACEAGAIPASLP